MSNTAKATVRPSNVAKFTYSLFKISTAGSAIALVLVKYGSSLSFKALRGDIVAMTHELAAAWRKSRLEVGADAGVLSESIKAVGEEIRAIWDDPAQRSLLLIALAAAAAAFLSWWLLPIALAKIGTFLTTLATSREILLALPH